MVPNIRDLTDPRLGAHAMQLLLDGLVTALGNAWNVPAIIERAHPVVSVRDNYDRLHYPPDGAARDARYTRYVAPDQVLRTQTTAMIPPLLRKLATATSTATTPDVLLVCPGLVYRRDTIDRWHTGEPHQVDLWRIRRDHPLARADLLDMIDHVVHAALPGANYRTIPATHPYTVHGLQIDVGGQNWLEIGECGLALPALLDEQGLDARSYSGLAMGLGLDRLLMERKQIPDIRLLRSNDPRIAEQMLDLSIYRPVSSMPPIRRDLSLAVAEAITAEELGDRVRETLGARAESVEAIEVLSETPHAELPPIARERIGMSADQKNVLLRIVLRDLTRTLTDTEANLLRDEIYAALHQGSIHNWATRR